MSLESGLLARQAKLVLDFNWTGEYTTPGPRLYPHQWSWDSALIAIGYAHYDPERAIRELTHLFEAQWKNGMLPQIVFSPDPHDYFPGADFWHAEESPNAPHKCMTSCVVQPPVHATAALCVYRCARDAAGVKEFLERAFPRLKSWHEYLYRERDPADEGLVYIRHPWESGMDDSPMWDGIMQRMRLRPEEIPPYRRVDTHLVAAEDRPVSAEYDRFAYLVRLFARSGHDEERIREGCPFLVQDVLFNAVLCRAGKDLAEIARVLGEDASPYEAQADKTARAINEKLWDEEQGIYLDFDLLDGEPIHAYAAAGFSPLFASIPDEIRALRMVEGLESFGLGQENGCHPVPSYDPYGFGFSPVQYWRGPVWININWLLLRGFERYGFREHAERLRRTIIELVRDQGFYKYYDPTTGKGHGSDLFSWTAPLLLDVLNGESG